MLVKELCELSSGKELVSIKRDCHDEELTGYILEATENVVLMTLVDSDGVFEGFTVFETDQITEVFWGNREHKAISILSEKALSMSSPSFNSEEFSEFIIEAANNFPSICLHSSHDEDSFDIVEIEAHDDDWLKVHTYGVKKSLSRMKKLVSTSEITRIVVCSPYQEGIVGLHAKGL